MPVNAVTTSTPVTATNQSNAASSLQLGKDAFMKMMIESLRQQDPSNAADSKEFVQQLSQMTSLEQITNMATATANLATEQREARAVGMLGKTVGYLASDGLRVEGVVEAVDRSSGSPLLKVGGRLLDPGSVTDVR